MSDASQWIEIHRPKSFSLGVVCVHGRNDEPEADSDQEKLS